MKYEGTNTQNVWTPRLHITWSRGNECQIWVILPGLRHIHNSFNYLQIKHNFPLICLCTMILSLIGVITYRRNRKFIQKTNCLRARCKPTKNPHFGTFSILLDSTCQAGYLFGNFVPATLNIYNISRMCPLYTHFADDEWWQYPEYPERC